MNRPNDPDGSESDDPVQPNEETISQRFWDIACDHEDLLKAGLGINVFLVTLLLVALPGIESGSPAHVVTVINFAFLAPLIALMIVAIWRCRRRTPRDRF